MIFLKSFGVFNQFKRYLNHRLFPWTTFAVLCELSFKPHNFSAITMNDSFWASFFTQLFFSQSLELQLPLKLVQIHPAVPRNLPMIQNMVYLKIPNIRPRFKLLEVLMLVPCPFIPMHSNNCFLFPYDSRQLMLDPVFNLMSADSFSWHDNFWLLCCSWYLK